MGHVGQILETMLHELEQTLLQVQVEQADALAAAILPAKHIFIAGAGRSGFAGRGFAMRLMHMGFAVYVVGETVTPSIGEQDLLLIISGSGETGSLLAMANKACAIGAHVSLITTQPQSTIAKMADAVVHIPAPTKAEVGQRPASIQPMGSLFEQSAWLFLDAVILGLMELRGEDSAHMFTRHANLE